MTHNDDLPDPEIERQNSALRGSLFLVVAGAVIVVAAAVSLVAGALAIR